MKSVMKMIVLGAAAAAGLGLAAWAAEGTYTNATGTKLTLSAASAHVELPDGAGTFDVPLMVEGNMVAFVAGADDPTCPGQTGTYTVSETAEGLTFTLQADDCQVRKDDLTSGVWKKAE